MLPVIEGEIPNDQEKAMEDHLEMAQGQVQGPVQMVQAQTDVEESLTEASIFSNTEAVKHSDHQIMSTSGQR